MSASPHVRESAQANRGVSPSWIVYGLLANRADDHDLRLIGRTDTPQALADAHPEYEACMAFPEQAACQLTPGSKIVDGMSALALIGLGQGRFPNAAERAG